MSKQKHSTTHGPGLCGLLSVLVVTLAALFITACAEASIGGQTSVGSAVLDGTSLTVLIASALNAVVPRKYLGYVAPIVELLSLAFWSGKNRDSGKEIRQ